MMRNYKFLKMISTNKLLMLLLLQNSGYWLVNWFIILALKLTPYTFTDQFSSIVSSLWKKFIKYCYVLFSCLVSFPYGFCICIYWLKSFSWVGLVLREIKDFWRGALMLSLLLYPEDICLSNKSSSEDTELNERRELFHRVENAILEMGTA